MPHGCFLTGTLDGFFTVPYKSPSLGKANRDAAVSKSSIEESTHVRGKIAQYNPEDSSAGLRASGFGLRASGFGLDCALIFYPSLCRILLLFCFLVALLAGMGCAEREKTSAGLVVLGPAEHDFGRHHQEEVLAHEFTLVNKLLTAVKIVEVTTSCGCLVPGKIADTIAPGERISLPVRFTTGAAQEMASANVLVGYRQVSDTADSGEPQYVRLRVRADIIPDYRITPREIDLGVVDGLTDQRLSRIVHVVPEAAADVKILEVKSLSAFLQAEILPKDTHGSETQVKASLDFSGFTESREINGSFVLSTDSKRVAKAIVYVRGKYKSPAQIVPNTLVIGSDEQGEAARELRITSSQPARVHKVRCSGDKRARIEFNNELMATEHVLHLFIAPCQEKPFDGEIQVEMQLFPDGREKTIRTLRVPVHRFSQKGVKNE